MQAEEMQAGVQEELPGREYKHDLERNSPSFADRG